MRRAAASCLIFACTAVVSACAMPVSGDFYSPSASYGTAVSEYCRNSVGPKNSMKMEFGSLVLILSADPVGKSSVHLNLQILGDTGSIGGFTPDGIGVYDDDAHVSLEKQDVKNLVSKTEANYSAYSFTIAGAPKHFSVTLPSTSYGGKHYDDLAIHFLYTSGTWFEVPNC